MSSTLLSVLSFAALMTCTMAASSLSTTTTWKFESCDFDNLDKCAQIVMLFGARSLVIPNNTADMVPHCEEEKSAVRCVSDWGKNCLKASQKSCLHMSSVDNPNSSVLGNLMVEQSFSRHLLKIALSGGARNIRERCAPKGTKWYLDNFKCVNDSLPDCHDCMDVVKKEVSLIHLNPNKKEWIPTGCCYLDRFRSCFATAVTPHCSQDGINFLNWCINSYFSDVVDMACTKDLTWTGDKCQKLVSHIKVPSNYTEQVPHSLFVPLYKLLLEFGDIDGVAREFLPFNKKEV